MSSANLKWPEDYREVRARCICLTDGRLMEVGAGGGVGTGHMREMFADEGGLVV